MRKQQLILLILGILITGATIKVGANMLSSSASAMNRDAVFQDCMTIAIRAQQWYQTPSVLGGGNRSFENFSFEAINFPSNNENGIYAISNRSNNQITITGTGRKPQAKLGTVRIVVLPDTIEPPIFEGAWQ
ncbi:MAG: hypothetical protein ONB31_10700 [candidate division KSB1 bacterium]|nr:hypothetical protein [candidate division KSB1 bacterium]MDZ7335782.1 hypothetical protein [candidate division KSB1 bacterium]MDZ7400769.1 hypothetical protein [candidate division KSB1 bacterium]